MSGAATLTHRHDDRGAALPLVLVLVTMMAVTVLALSAFASTSLKFGNVAEDRSDRLSAADAGMRYAIDQLKLRNAGCILDTQKAVLPGVSADFNFTSATVTCERITSGFEGIQAFAAVMTGAGLPPTETLLTTQSGSNTKIFGGPVYMARVEAAAFDLKTAALIENGPLLYHDDSGAVPCSSIKPSALPSDLDFSPELIFGPVCVTVPWQELFTSPTVPDLTTLIDRDGSLPTGPPLGSYTDIGGCRVFEPGRYIVPPDVVNTPAYFKTGDYLFDFAPANNTFAVDMSIVTAGRINPLTTTANENPNPLCDPSQNGDPAPATEFGATFYLAGPSRINIKTQGSFEIHTRQQGAADYVSIQALCTPNGDWCDSTGGGSFSPDRFSSVTAASGDSIIYTDSGNKKELVAHALLYTPESQFEFGNVTNTATQKMLGGMIVSRLVLQSSTSATNFEISVPTSPITAEIKLTSTAYKGAATSVQAVVEYRPYEPDIGDRIRVNSWRVCEFDDCSATAPVGSPCTSDAQWAGKFYNNDVTSYDDIPGGVIVHEESTASLNYSWGTSSPHPSVNSDYFSARWTRNITFGSAGVYQFTVGTDDGQEFFVNGVSMFQDWQAQTLADGTNIFTVNIVDPCNVDLELIYFERTGTATAFISWLKL